MSSALHHLETVLYTGRAPTQRKVFRSLLEGRAAAFEIAEDTGLSKNSVNIALYELVKAGVVDRPLRARYYVNVTLLTLALNNRVRELEKMLLKIRGAGEKSAPTPKLTSTTAPQPAHGGEPS